MLDATQTSDHSFLPALYGYKYVYQFIADLPYQVYRVLCADHDAARDLSTDAA